MNWGYKIMVVYIVFIAGIGMLVYNATAQNKDLVVTDYYEQELKYQDKMDAITRSNALSASLICTLDSNMIRIRFPHEMQGKKISADVLLYTPSDEKKDIQKNIVTEDAVIYFNIPKNAKGFHRIKITWKADAVNYYFEQKIMIP